MGFKREEHARAVAEGYYHSYSSYATEILDYIINDIPGVEPDASAYPDGQVFKVTVTVEQV